jgi:hypothetical protein
MCMTAYFYIQIHACSQRRSSLQHSFGWIKIVEIFFSIPEMHFCARRFETINKRVKGFDILQL